MNNQEHYIDNDTPAFLCYAPNDIEAGRIGSMLESYKIPVMIRRSESGGVASILMGMSLTSVDIYVPSKLLETAREILSLGDGEGYDEENNNEEDNNEESNNEENGYGNQNEL